MHRAIDKAAALIEAHAYIRRFQGKVVVVKLGGSFMDDPASLRSVIQDVCFMHLVGMRPLIVHGGGKKITAAMQAAGIEAQFVLGMRYTDERTLAIAEHVLVKDINEDIQRTIAELGPRPMGLHSLASCAVFAQRLFLQDPTNVERKRVDVGMVGEVTWVNASMLEALLEAKVIPVIAPIARDQAGGKLNVNADSVAGHVAAAMKADKLVLVSDTHGIRTAKEDSDSVAQHLSKADIEGLIQQGVIGEGMLPKVDAAVAALTAGVGKVHIIDGRIDHALLLEVYTDEGIGTEIVLE